MKVLFFFALIIMGLLWGGFWNDKKPSEIPEDKDLLVQLEKRKPKAKLLNNRAGVPLVSKQEELSVTRKTENVYADYSFSASAGPEQPSSSELSRGSSSFYDSSEPASTSDTINSNEPSSSSSSSTYYPSSYGYYDDYDYSPSSFWSSSLTPLSPFQEEVANSDKKVVNGQQETSKPTIITGSASPEVLAQLGATNSQKAVTEDQDVVAATKPVLTSSRRRKRAAKPQAPAKEDLSNILVSTSSKQKEKTPSKTALNVSSTKASTTQPSPTAQMAPAATRSPASLSQFSHYDYEIYDFNPGVNNSGQTLSPPGDLASLTSVIAGPPTWDNNMKYSLDKVYAAAIKSLVSLGFGGELVIRLDAPLDNKLGPEFIICENNFGGFQENAKVYIQHGKENSKGEIIPAGERYFVGNAGQEMVNIGETNPLKFGGDAFDIAQLGNKTLGENDFYFIIIVDSQTQRNSKLEEETIPLEAGSELDGKYEIIGFVTDPKQEENRKEFAGESSQKNSSYELLSRRPEFSGFDLGSLAVLNFRKKTQLI